MFVYLKICYSVVIFYRDDFIFIERKSKIDCWKMMCRNRERFEVFLLKYYIIVVVCVTSEILSGITCSYDVYNTYLCHIIFISISHRRGSLLVFMQITKSNDVKVRRYIL